MESLIEKAGGFMDVLVLVLLMMITYVAGYHLGVYTGRHILVRWNLSGGWVALACGFLALIVGLTLLVGFELRFEYVGWVAAFFAGLIREVLKT